MITLTFTDPTTGNDVSWSVPVKEHSPLLEKRSTATADAGDYVAPDVHYKGSYKLTKLTSNPIPASEIQIFYQMREATKKGGEVVVGASVVPLVGVDYSAIRLGDTQPKSLHGGRFFSFALNLRVNQEF